MSLKGHIQDYEASRALPPCRNRMLVTQGHEMKAVNVVPQFPNFLNEKVRLDDL